MLASFLQTLSQDLELDEVPKKSDAGIYTFPLTSEMHIQMKESESRIVLWGRIGECPRLKREDFFIYLMKANFLGQGTGNCVIGLDEDEKFLTLSSVLTYDMNYKLFRDALEDFANYLDYWKEELVRHNTMI